MKQQTLMTETEANRVFNILVDYCGVAEDLRDQFVYDHIHNDMLKSCGSSEYRIYGKLGFGGKFRINYAKYYVDYYQEDETPDRKKTVQKTNELLAIHLKLKQANLL